MTSGPGATVINGVRATEVFIWIDSMLRATPMQSAFAFPVSSDITPRVDHVALAVTFGPSPSPTNA
jgi:hypothetical protein